MTQHTPSLSSRYSPRRRTALAAAVLLIAALPLALQTGAADAAGAAAVSADSYGIFQAPAVNPGDASNDAYNNAVEPSIGYDVKTGATNFQADLTTYSVSFDDAKGTSTWAAHKPVTTSQTTLDPILATDKTTGRSFISQLAGNTSLLVTSDDDGATSTPGVVLPSGVDHETVGAGPFSALAGIPINAVYPDAVYYCSQAIAASFCSLSIDGGLTFGASNAIYTAGGPMIDGCGGLHGHVRVRADGTAMVPNQGCGPNTLATGPVHQGITTNNSNNVGPWTLDLVPDSTATANSDPSVNSDPANTVYFGYEDGPDAAGNHPGKIAVQKLGGPWSTSVDVGAALGVKSIAFPEVIAGSTGRAAMAFLGTTTAGDYQDTAFAGAWQLYIARTDDSGATWRTQQVTTDTKYPVQVGCIQLGGPCTHRNLYDFNDITTDSLGRVEVGFADGCVAGSGCATGATAAGAGDDTNVGTIARQECGQSLFASEDAALSAACPNVVTVSSVTPPSAGTVAAAAGTTITPKSGTTGKVPAKKAVVTRKSAPKVTPTQPRRTLAFTGAHQVMGGLALLLILLGVGSVAVRRRQA